MKLALDALPRQLQQPLAPLYVVHGDEPLLALEALDQLRAAARRQGYTERTVLTVEQHFDWNALHQTGAELSLFAQLRLVELRIPGGKPGVEGSKALEAYARRLPQDTVTLVALPKLDGTQFKSAWFKALDQHGQVIEAAPIPLANLPGWLGQRMAAHGQRATSEALQLLADRVEGNLLAARQELDKLALLYPAGELSLEQVAAVTSDVARYEVFQLSEAMLCGDAPRLMRMLDGLRQEGEAPTLALWVVAEDARALLKVGRARQEGTDEAQACRDARVWGAKTRWVGQALRRVKASHLHAALQGAAEVDRIIKGLSPGDAWDALTRVALGLCLAPRSLGALPGQGGVAARP